MYLFFFVDASLIGYLHGLSPIKTSQRNNNYFEVQLQTETNTLRSVCFSAEKYPEFQKKHESSSPVKLTNYSLKRNERSNADEVHINKRTKLHDPQPTEVTFDIKNPIEVPQVVTMSNVHEALKAPNNSQVTVKGKIVFDGPQEKLKTKNGKVLQKQEAFITDDSDIMRLVLWESDMTRIKPNNAYQLQKVMVRSFNNTKYLTLNKQSVIIETQEQFDNVQDINMASQYKTVKLPPVGVGEIQQFLSCAICKTKVIPAEEGAIVKCSECSRSQLLSRCPKSLFAPVEFDNNSDKTLSLNLFEDKLLNVYGLYKTQQNVTKSFDDFTHSDITQMLLLVDATVIYNDKKNIVSIRA